MMTAADPKKAIRRDLFAVKVMTETPDGSQWCVQRIFRDRLAATKWLRGERAMRQRCKLVHPAQWVVDGYLAYGNQIW